jgi:hypothetical protein
MKQGEVENIMMIAVSSFKRFTESLKEKMYDYIARRSFFYTSENFSVNMKNNLSKALDKIGIYASIKCGHEEEE